MTRLISSLPQSSINSRPPTPSLSATLQTSFSTISSGAMADLFFRAPDSSQSVPNPRYISTANRFLEITTDDDLLNFWGTHGNDEDAVPPPEETTLVASSENRRPEATAMGHKRRTRHDKTPRPQGSNRYGRKGVQRCRNCRKGRQKVGASFCGGCLIENSVNITVRKIPVKGVFYTGFDAVRNCGGRRWKRTCRKH